MKNLENLKRSFTDLMVTFGTNVKKPDEIQLIPLAEILNKIQNEENLTQLIFQLRSIHDKNERSQFKQNKLPWLALPQFDGKRNNNSFISTEAMIFDMDDLTEVEVIKKHLMAWKYTSAVFLSPSGKGLKLIIKLARPITTAEEYSLVYLKIAGLIESEFVVSLDKATKDPARACFLSSDPDIYINEDADSIDADDESLFANTPSNTQTESRSQTKLEEIQKILLGVPEGERHTSMIKLIGAYIKKGFTKEMIKKAIISWNSLNEPPLPLYELDNEFERAYEGFVVKTEISFRKFWGYNNQNKLIIKMNDFIEFLQDQGIFKIKHSFDTYSYVMIKNNIVKNISIPEIQETVKAFIKNNITDKKFQEALLNLVVNQANTIFIKPKLDFLGTTELKIKNDTKDISYVYFKDAFIEITSEAVFPKTYDNLGSDKIWIDSIIDYNIGDLDMDENNISSEFDCFIRRIAQDDQDVYEALISSLGYMLHTYKDPAKTKAIICVDQEIPVGNEANGGTGKSLFSKALKFIRKTKILDAKKFKDDKFNFQRIEIGDQIIVFDDAIKGFDLEILLSAITGDLIIERKGKHPITIGFSEAPKFIISTNYTIKGHGNSYDRRKYEIEFSNFFNKDNTPDKYFGHRLFEDWDDVEWGRFYRSMIHYIQFYLKNGLTVYNAKNLPMRKLINETRPEFVEFVEDNVKIGTEYIKRDLYERFIEINSTFRNLKPNTITIWLKKYADYLGYEYIERDSNSIRYVTLETIDPIKDAKDSQIDANEPENHSESTSTRFMVEITDDSMDFGDVNFIEDDDNPF